MITLPAFALFAIVLLNSFDFSFVGRSISAQQQLQHPSGSCIVSGSAVSAWNDDIGNDDDDVDNVVRVSNGYALATDWTRRAATANSALTKTTTGSTATTMMTVTVKPATLEGAIGRRPYRHHYLTHHQRPYQVELMKRNYHNLQPQQHELHQEQPQQRPDQYQQQQVQQNEQEHYQPYQQEPQARLVPNLYYQSKSHEQQKLHQQGQQQQQRETNMQLVPDLYAEFDRRMEQLDHYARDRVDSSRRWHLRQINGNADNMHVHNNIAETDAGNAVGKVNNHKINHYHDLYDPIQDLVDETAHNNRAKRDDIALADVSDDGPLRLGKVLNVQRTHLLKDQSQQQIHDDTVAIANRIKASQNQPHSIERVLVWSGAGSRTAALPELHLDEQKRRGEALHRQLAATTTLKRPSSWPGPAVQRMPQHAKAQTQIAADSFAFREACELCSSQRRAIEPQMCCPNDEGTVRVLAASALPMTHTANKRHAIAVRRRDVGSDAVRKRQPFAMGINAKSNKNDQITSDTSYAQTRKLLNTNGASAFPAVVVKASPNLASYKKLMLRSSNSGATNGRFNTQMQSSSSPTMMSSGSSGSSNRGNGNAPTADHSYADFLNYFERLQRQQQQQQQPQTNGDNDANASLWKAWAHNGLTMRNANETMAPNVTSATNATSASTTTNAAASTTANKPESLPTGTTNRLSSESLSSPLPSQPPADCAKYIDADNSSSALLQRVLDELQRMRAEKSTGQPEGEHIESSNL